MTDSAYDHARDRDAMPALSSGPADRMKEWFRALSLRAKIAAGVFAVCLVALIIFGVTYDSGQGSATAAMPLNSRFDFSGSDPQTTAKQAEFRQIVLRKFEEQSMHNDTFQRQLNDIRKAKPADPKVLEQLQKDIDELKQLVLLKDKVAEIEKVTRSISERLAGLVISKANAETSPPSVPVDFARYEEYARECQGALPIDPSKKEYDARELNKQPEAMYEDVLVQCREKRKPNTSASVPKPPPAPIAAPVPPPVQTASNPCLPGYTVNPADPGECV